MTNKAIQPNEGHEMPPGRKKNTLPTRKVTLEIAERFARNLEASGTPERAYRLTWPKASLYEAKMRAPLIMQHSRICDSVANLQKDREMSRILDKEQELNKSGTLWESLILEARIAKNARDKQQLLNAARQARALEADATSADTPQALLDWLADARSSCHSALRFPVSTMLTNE